MKKKKVKKYQPGGKMDQVASAVGLANPALGKGLGLFAEFMDSQKADVPSVNTGANPYEFKHGGSMKGFEQYMTGAHSEGGQTINTEGVPTNVNPAAEIEKNENMLKYYNLPDKQGQQYIFSDENGTSKMLKGVMKKYITDNHKPDLDEATRNVIEFEAREIEAKNEQINAAKVQEQAPEMTYGGKFPNGGNPNFDIYKAANTAIQGMNAFASGEGLTNPTGNRSDFSITSAPEQSIDQTAGAANTELYDPNSGNTPSFGNVNSEDLLTGLGYGMKAIDAFLQVDQDKLHLPDFGNSDERFNKMTGDLTQARQSALGQSNAASQLNRNASSSYSQLRNRELSNIAGTQESLANIALNEQQLRNSVLGQQGAYEQGKAVMNRNIVDDVQVRNLQNEAQGRNNKRQFAADLISTADTIAANKNIKNIANASLEESKLILNTMFPDFNISDTDIKLIQQLSRGEITQDEFNEKAPKELINYSG